MRPEMQGVKKFGVLLNVTRFASKAPCVSKKNEIVLFKTAKLY